MRGNLPGPCGLAGRGASAALRGWSVVPATAGAARLASAPSPSQRGSRGLLRQAPRPMPNDLAALYMQNPLLFAGSVCLLGLVVGSFLNVVIYRLPIILEREWRAQAIELLPGVTTDTTVVGIDPPARFTLSHPRSACPACKAPIKTWQNIPVLSWLLLRGHCAACRTRISARYPIVELATGV